MQNIDDFNTNVMNFALYTLKTLFNLISYLVTTSKRSRPSKNKGKAWRSQYE